MNTIMEEKIKQAFQEWKQTEQPPEQLKDTIMQTTPHTQSQNRTLTDLLLTKISTTPGITGKELRQYAVLRMPKLVPSHVPALLKGLFDAGAVNRLSVEGGGGTGRPTFAYTFVPENQRVRREKSNGYKNKVKRPYVRHTTPVETPTPQSQGITTLVPTEPLLPTLPTAEYVLKNLSVQEAFALYQQLNQMFGGAR